MEYSELTSENVEAKGIEYENIYDKESAYIQSLFPKAKFKISIEYDELDEIVTKQPSIIAICDFNCLCYRNHKRNTEYYYIKGKTITNRFIIESLIDQGFEPKCKHRYLEGFLKMKNSEFKYEMLIGS
jgi:hypothetical protein